MTTRHMVRRLVCTVAAVGCLAVVVATVPAVGPDSDAETAVKKYIQLWNTGDLSGANTILAAEVTRRGPAPVFFNQGRDSLEESIAGTRKTYENFTVTIDDIESAGNRVILHWNATGTYLGTNYPEGAGRKIDISGTSFFQVEHGKIVHEDVSWDHLRGFEQIGVTQPMLDPAERNKEIADAFMIELYEKGNMAAAYELVADDFVYHGPAGKEGPIGPRGAQQRAAIFRTAFPDLKFTTGDVIAEGDIVASRWTFEGTHRGPFLGYEQTDKRVSISGLSMVRVENGKIAEAWGVWDRGDLLEQIR